MLKNRLFYVIIIYRIGDYIMNGKNVNNTSNNNAVFSSNQTVSGNTAASRVKTRYKYTCYDKEGKTVKGYFDAFRRLDVESFLNSQGYKILEIKETKISKFGDFLTLERPMKYKDLVFFLTQLSTYIKSGIPLTDSIVMLDEQTKNKNRKNLYKKILYELNTGAPFSEALARQGNIFPKLLINMLKTSELTGNLTEALDDMAAYYKTADTNRKQIISALTYPSVVLVVAIIAVAGVIIILIAMYKNIKKFRYFVQYILMHIPIIKNVIIDNQIVMFTKTFSSLIRHDVFITDSIEMLGKVTNNEIYKDIIKEAVTNLSTGAGLSKAFEDKWAFPRIAYEMLVTGEKTGRLGVMMENVASYYEEEQKALVQRLKSLIEPVMIILLAGIVGVVLLAIFVPMFSMYNDIL